MILQKFLWNHLKKEKEKELGKNLTIKESRDLIQEN